MHRVSLGASAADPARWLRFPAGTAAGYLHIRSDDERSESGWEPLCSAAGSVQLPADQDVILSIHRPTLFGPDGEDRLLLGRVLSSLAGSRLYGVDIEGALGASDEHADHLCQIPSLRYLSLHGSSVTSAGVARIIQGLRLRTFHLAACSVDADCVNAVADADSVEWLCLAGTRPPGNWLGRVAKMPSLSGLSLGGIDLSACDLTPLNACPALRYLRMPGCFEPRPDLSAIAGMCRLESIDLSDVPLSTRQVAHIGAQESLSFLSLFGCSLQPEALGPLSRLSHLTSLDLGSNPIGGGLSTVRLSAGLQYLGLGDTGFTDTDAAIVRETDAPLHIDLDGNPLSDAGLAGLCRHRSIVGLQLGGTAISDKGMRDVAALQHLRALSVSDTAVTDRGLGALASLQHLETLDMNRCAITDAGLARLGSLPELRHVSACETEVTYRGVAQLACAARLRSLHLSGPLPAADAHWAFPCLSRAFYLALPGCFAKFA